jgi:hypothetical protein
MSILSLACQLTRSPYACACGLQDILEIPELMETYVRSELYDEALQLEAFTHGLKKKHPDIPLIQSIATDVDKSREMMINQLHHKLRGIPLRPDTRTPTAVAYESCR